MGKSLLILASAALLVVMTAHLLLDFSSSSEILHSQFNVFLLALAALLCLLLTVRVLFLLARQAPDFSSLMSEMQLRIQEQKTALLRLACSQIQASGDLQAAAGELTETACDTLQVDQVSVWLFDTDHSSIFCLQEFDRKSRGHTGGDRIPAAECPAYFDAICRNRVLVVDNTSTDPVTRDFLFVQNAGIKSMLDAPFHVDGKLTGIVCHEMTTRTRCWSVDEQHFASSIADMMSRAMQASQRRKLVEQMRELALFPTLDPSPNLRFDRTGAVISANPAASEIFNITSEMHVPISRLIGSGMQFEPAALIDSDGVLCCTCRIGDKWFNFVVRGISDLGFGQAYGSDITSLKAVQETLRESEQFLRQVIDSNPNLIFVKDRQCRFSLVNQAVADIYGTTVDALIGK